MRAYFPALMSHPTAPPRPAIPLSLLLADATCLGILMPLLASYAAQFEASSTAIGAMVAVYSLLQVLLAPFWGRLSDRYGRRPILVLGLFGSFASSVMFTVAGDFLVLALSRVVAGGLGGTINVTQAYAADLTTPERRTRVMGYVGAAFGVGFVLGPTIGGMASSVDPMAPGLVASVITGLNFLAALVLLPEVPARRREAFAPVTVSPRPFLVPFGAAFLSTLAFTVIYIVFPLHMEQRLGFDRSGVSYLFALLGLMTALVQGGLVGRLSRRVGEGWLVVAGGWLMGLGLTGLALTITAPAALYPALVALGIGFGLAGPAEAGYISRVANPVVQGRVLGLLQSVNSSARVIGPVAAGALMGLGGAGLAFVAAAGAALGAAGLGTRMRRPPSG